MFCRHKSRSSVWLCFVLRNVIFMLLKCCAGTLASCNQNTMLWKVLSLLGSVLMVASFSYLLSHWNGFFLSLHLRLGLVKRPGWEMGVLIKQTLFASRISARESIPGLPRHPLSEGSQWLRTTKSHQNPFITMFGNLEIWQTTTHPLSEAYVFLMADIFSTKMLLTYKSMHAW